MRPVDYAVCLIMAIVMIIGGYQFYFFVQKHHVRKAREFDSAWLDDRVPFRPRWVWIYAALYYPVILLLVFAQPSYEQFSKKAFSYLVLLAMQFAAFYFFPVRIPARWRDYDPKGSWSLRMLAFVHSFDKFANSIPSMHVSVATLTAIYLYEAFAPGWGAAALLAWAFPVLIALSAVFTKQHYVYDLVPGAVFGWLAWLFSSWMLG